MNVSVSVVNGKTIIDTKDLSAVEPGKSVRIKAIKGGQYVLAEGEQGFAPENITIKRVGKNLHVALEGTSPDQPELIIEDFYEYEGQLVGMAEDSTYYEYVAVDGDADHSAPFLLDGTASPLALGGSQLVGYSDGLAVLAGGVSLTALGLGGLGLLGAGLAVGKSSDDNKDDYHLDTTPPANPGIGGVFDDKGPITGLVPDGGFTDDDTPTLKGVGLTPGDKIIISDNGQTIGEVIVDGDGNWSFTPETGLGEGDHSLSIVVQDPAGNASQPSPPHVIIVDTKPPANPGIGGVFDNKGPITGLVPDGGITDDDTPTLKGVGLTPGDKVIVSDNGQIIGEVIVDGDGNWSFTPETGLGEGDHSLSIVVQDPAGNTSQPSPPHVIIVDTKPPANPGIGGVYDDKGPITGLVPDGGITDDDTPTLKGVGLTPGDKIIVSDNGQTIGEVIVDGDGNWSFTPETGLGEGDHSLSIIVQNPAGNASQPSPPHVIIVNTQSPLAPLDDDAVLLDDVGPIQGIIKNGGSTDDSTPTYQGKAEPNATVVIYDLGLEIGRVPTDAAGNWKFTPNPELTDGQHSLNYVVVNSAGTQSESSSSIEFIVDTYAPVHPSIESVFDDQGEVQGNLTQGDTTDDAKPTINGKAEAGSTVVIRDLGVEIGRASVDAAGEWSFTPRLPMGNGQHSLTVIAVDAAGNVSESSPSFDFTLASGEAPAAPAINAVKDDVGTVQGNLQKDAVTDDARPTVEGTAQAGSTISVYSNGQLLGTTVADSKGVWSFTPDIDLAEGLNNLSATATNSAGNISPQTGLYPITVDTTVPATPGASDAELLDDAGAIQGPINSGDITDDSTPTFKGHTESNATVVIYDNDQEIGRVATDAQGNWSFTPSTPLTDGPHSLNYAVIDAAGNLGAKSPAVDFSVDTSAVTISLDRVMDDFGSIQGQISQGGVTDDTTPTLNGKATANATVNLYDNGVLIGSTTSNASGVWSFTPATALAEGAHNLTATVTTTATGESDPTAGFGLVIDTTAPSKGSIDAVIDDVGDIQGPIVNGGSTDDTTPSLSGTAEAGSTVHVYDGANLLGSVLADNNGKWSFTPSPLNNGEHSFTVVAEDKAGNKGVASDPFVITFDTTAPSAPSLDSVFDDQGDVQGALNSGDITDDSKPQLSGTAEAGSTVVIYDGKVEIGRAPVDAAGNWTFTPSTPLGNGAHKLSVTSVDAAGNASVNSNEFVIDVQAGEAPAAPAINAVKDDVGTVQGNLQKDAVTDDARPTVEGTAQAGSTISVYSNGQLLGTTVADSKGVWSFTPDTDLAEGLNNLSATATNSAGNISPQTGLYPITVDTVAPGQASGGLEDNVGNIQGPIAPGDVTDDNTPTFQGQAEGNATVIIYDNGTEIGRVLADAQGNWSFTPSKPLAEGPHSLNTAVLDTAGNLGELSPSIGFSVDTSHVVVSLDSVIDDAGSITGAISKGGVTDDTTPTLNGKATANATVNLYDNGVLIGSTTSNASGVWSFTPATALAEGAHNLTATVTTTATGESDPTAGFGLVIDTTAPSKGSIDAVIDDVGDIQGPIVNGGSTDDTTPSLSGTAEAGSTVHVYDGANLLGSVLADNNGKWSFTPSPLNNGEHSFTVVAEDKAGNKGVASDALVVTIDTSTPVAPSLNSVFDDQGDVQGNLQKDAVTDDTRPTVEGTAQAGTTISVYSNGILLGTTLADSNGIWSFTPGTDLAEGLNNLSATATNSVGNTSPQTDLYPIVVDTSVPATPGASDAELLDDAGAIQGPINSGDITDDNTPTFKGHTESNATVVIYDRGTEIGRVRSDAQGNWSFTPSTPLTDGPHSLNYAVINAAGNLGEQGTAIDFSVDTSTVTISIDSVMDDFGSIKGQISKGGVTDDTTPTLNGKATANATVNLYDNGVLIGSTTSNASGVWSFTPDAPLALGAHSLAASVTTAANGESDLTDSYNFDIKVLSSGEETFDGNWALPTSSPQGVTLLSGLSIKQEVKATSGNSGATSGGNFLVGNNAVMLFEFPGLVQIIAFDLNYYNGVGGRVEYLDQNGDIVSSRTFTAQTSNMTANIVIIAPEGTYYSGFRIVAGQEPAGDMGFSIGRVYWAEYSYPKTLIQSLEDEVSLQDTVGVVIEPDTVLSGEVFTVDSHALSSNQEISLHGTAGVDTLNMEGANQVLDLTALGEKFNSIEIVDITGAGNNTLKLSLAEVLGNGSVDFFHETEHHTVQMMVKGDAGDKVELNDLLGTQDLGDWANQGQLTSDGLVYEVYQHSGMDAELLVQQGVTVILT